MLVLVFLITTDKAFVLVFLVLLSMGVLMRAMGLGVLVICPFREWTLLGEAASYIMSASGLDVLVRMLLGFLSSLVMLLVAGIMKMIRLSDVVSRVGSVQVAVFVLVSGCLWLGRWEMQLMVRCLDVVMRWVTGRFTMLSLTNLTCTVVLLSGVAADGGAWGCWALGQFGWQFVLYAAVAAVREAV